jgi:hypothetical protein
VPRALRGDGQPVELTREAYGKVADVDHLLHLAVAFLQDLAGLDRHQSAERCLVRAQLLAEQADQLAAPRRRHFAPGTKSLGGHADLRLHIGRAIGAQHGDLAAVDRGTAGEILAGVGREIHAQVPQEFFRFHAPLDRCERGAFTRRPT